MLSSAQRSAWRLRASDVGAGLPIVETLWVRRVKVARPPPWLGAAPRLSQAPDRSPANATADFICVRDKPGHVGLWGPVEPVVATLALHWLRPRIEGRRFAGPQEVYDTIYAAERHGRTGLATLALGALDLALWDLLGQVHGLPVYALFGGAPRAVPCYASLLSFALTADTAPMLALEAHRMGFVGSKWAIRDRMPSAGIPALAAIAARRPPGGALMVDALGAWDLAAARRFCREVADLDLAWVEEPLPPRAWVDYGRLTRSTGVPIAAGEHAYTRHEAMGLIHQGISILQPDAAWCGGLTEFGHIVEAAQVAGIRVFPHGAGLIPAVHLASIMGSDVIPAVEYHMTVEPYRQGCFAKSLLPQNGVVVASTAPGFGICIDSQRALWDDIRDVSGLKEAG